MGFSRLFLYIFPCLGFRKIILRNCFFSEGFKGPPQVLSESERPP